MHQVKWNKIKTEGCQVIVDDVALLLNPNFCGACSRNFPRPLILLVHAVWHTGSVTAEDELRQKIKRLLVRFVTVQQNGRTRTQRHTRAAYACTHARKLLGQGGLGSEKDFKHDMESEGKKTTDAAARLAETIIANLQLTVRRVHLRYPCPSPTVERRCGSKRRSCR